MSDDEGHKSMHAAPSAKFDELVNRFDRRIIPELKTVGLVKVALMGGPVGGSLL